MLVIDNGDKIRGDASVAAVVDYTLHGLIGNALTQLADGQLPDAIGDLYTSAEDGVALTAMTITNTDSSPRTINIYLTPSGGTARRLLPKDMTLGAGYSLIFDGQRISVLDINGSTVSTITVMLDNTPGGTDNEVLKAPTSDVMYDHGVAVSGIHGVTSAVVGIDDVQTLTNKTLDATSLIGILSGGGSQINNVIIGTVTPLAGTFTALVATGFTITGEIIQTAGVLAFQKAYTLSVAGNLTLTPTGELILGSATGVAQMQTNGLTIGLTAGAPAPDNNAVHVWWGSAGVITAHTNAVFVLEGNTSTYLQFLCPSGSWAGLVFGDEGTNAVGRLLYKHTTDEFGFFLAGVERLEYGVGAFAFNEATVISTIGALTLAPTTELILGSATGVAQMQTNGITFGLAASAPDPDNNAVHIWAGDASQTAPADSYLVIEHSGSSYISMLAGNTFSSGIFFADDGSPSAGGLLYDHNDVRLRFRVEAGNRMYLTSSTMDFLQATTISTVGDLTLAPSTSKVFISGASAQLYLKDTGASGGFKNWRIVNASDVLAFVRRNDADDGTLHTAIAISATEITFDGDIRISDTSGINTGIVDDDYFTIGAVDNDTNIITELMRFVGAAAPYVKLTGALFGVEITTPTAVADHWSIYAKTDNEIYVQTGDGVEHTLLKGASGIKHTYVAPLEDPTGTVGNWDVVSIGTSQSVHFAFQVPEDFEFVINAKVVVIPDATETIQWDVLASVSAPGEAYNADDRSALDETLAVTDTLLTELSISGVLAGLSAGDYVAIDFQSDTANIRVVGLEFDYE